MGSQVLIAPPARGVKRAAADDLEREQRLSSRFDLLNLDTPRHNQHLTTKTQQLLTLATDTNGSKLHIPIPSDSVEQVSLPQTDSQPSLTMNKQTNPYNSEGMEVEDTPNRIYINDLDAEIAELEPSSPSHPIFIPDIEKHLLGLPSAVFQPSPEEEEQRREQEKAMQMVLYGVPTSLTLSEEQDNVKRAIEEARWRLRQKIPVNEHATSTASSTQYWPTHSALSGQPHSSKNIEDMMDMT